MNHCSGIYVSLTQVISTKSMNYHICEYHVVYIIFQNLRERFRTKNAFNSVHSIFQINIDLTNRHEPLVELLNQLRHRLLGRFQLTINFGELLLNFAGFSVAGKVHTL